MYIAWALFGALIGVSAAQRKGFGGRQRHHRRHNAKSASNLDVLCHRQQ